MAARLEFDAEPLPGYRLIERLGGGGFGEVWKCEAPGGLHKAIKFVYGDLQDADNGERAEQELKALARVKTVRHPYILSLERYDIIDGQLLIVMELADRNLWDRFKECRAQGMPGIPREELLLYLEETAEALDLMNIQYQLQHLDIKPQNLFLVHNHVKVADFGLVKDLEGLETKITGGITPVYAAPETFDGIVSRHCDQYSLAICYQELLTGQRPFSGANVRQLILQHLQGHPNVSVLPPCDQPVILRSLSKIAGERFPTCSEMIRLLRQGVPTPVISSPSAQGLAPDARPQSGVAPPILPSDSAMRSGQGGSGFHPGTDSALGTTQPLRAQPDASVLVPVDESQKVRPPQELKGDGSLFPSLVIGLGQTGLGVLRRLRERVVHSLGTLEAVPTLKLMLLDTDPDTARAAALGKTGTALHSSEVLLTPLNRPSHYLKPREGRPSLETWMPQRTLYRIPRSQVTTGVRALGRLAFCDNYRSILRHIEFDLEQILNQETLKKTVQETRLGLRTNRPRIYLVANLAGGTGSGMFLDLAYTLRALLRQRGYEQPDIVAILLLPDPRIVRPGSEALGNTVAALTELTYHATPGTVFQSKYHEREAPIQDADPPFSRTILLQLPEESEESAYREMLDMTGQLLYRELLTPFGRAADLARADLRSPAWGERGFYFHSFGLYRLSWPRRELLQEVSRHLCLQLIQRWMSKDSKPLIPAVTSFTREQWRRNNLGAEVFIERLQEALQAYLRKDSETAMLALVEPLVRTLRSQAPPPQKRWGQTIIPPTDIAPGDLHPVMEEFERLLGKPGEDSLHDLQGQLGAFLKETTETLTNEWSQKLAEITVHLIEEPEFRLAGAEEAVRQVLAQLEQILIHHEPLYRDLVDRSRKLHEALQEFLAQRGKQLQMELDDVITLLRSYPKTRLQALILQNVTQAFLALRGHLSDELREIGYCRTRLAELHRNLQAIAPPPNSSSASSTSLSGYSAQGIGLRPEAGRILFPEGCQNLAQAVDRVTTHITPEMLLELDHKIEGMIRQHFQALVNVCLTNANILRDVERCMLETAAQYVSGQLADVSVAELLLNQVHSTSQQVQEVASYLEAACPKLVCAPFAHRDGARKYHGEIPQQEIVVLVRPSSPAGETLHHLCVEALDGREVQTAPGCEDVLFYREVAYQHLNHLEHIGSAGLTAYLQMCAPDSGTPHTRTDVEYSSILPPR